ncbi:MAG: hypothetical protein JNM27_20780 [Leptospirales bacterium]|nr:hypothetical protein [Leptospirales bacterium]
MPRSFFQRLIGRFMRIMRLHPDVQPLLSGGYRLTNPSAAAYPSENLPFASRVIASGMWNYCFFQFYRHFAGPYWVERQYNPDDVSFIPRASSLLSLNLTHRTWMGIRSPNGTSFSMVDPAGSLSPIAGYYSVEVGIKDGTRVLLPTRGDLKVSQKPFKDLPAARTEYNCKGIQVKWTVVGCADEGDWVYSRVQYETNRPCELLVGIRPFNPEGGALISDLEMKLKAEGAVLSINSREEIFFPVAPDELRFSNLEAGDAYFQDKPLGIVNCRHGLATGSLVYRITGSGEIHFYARTNRTGKAGVPIQFVNNDHELNRSLTAWEKIVDQGAEFVCGRDVWNRAARIFAGYLNSLQTNTEIWPGVFTYNQFWFRDAAYMISALTSWGYTTQAAKILKTYAARQERDGFFKSHEGEWDSNGQAIWTLAHFIEHTGDQQMLRELYPAIRKGAQWIMRKRRTGIQGKILPAGFSAEHLGPADHYYWDNLWSIAGLMEASRCAGMLGEKKDERLFLEESDSYRRDLLAVSADDRQRFGVITAAPNRPIDSGMIGSICTVYPLELRVFPESEVRKTVREIHKQFFTKDLFFHPIIHSGYNLYLSLQMAQCHLRLGDVRRARRIFKRVLKSRTQLWTYPEAIHPITGGGVMGDGFHGWAFAEVLLLLREFVVSSQDRVLHIFRGLRNREILSDMKFGPFPMHGGKISIQGKLSESNDGRIKINFDRASEMRAIRIHVPGLRRKIKSVRIEGCDEYHFDRKKAIIEVARATAEIEIQILM